MSKEEFLKDVDNWSNHRFLLWPALEATKHLKLPVMELGCGNGSTPFLRKYCEDNGLELLSYDSNKEWAEKFNSIYVDDWNKVDWNREYSVVLVDESPGEHRKESIKLLKAHVIVVHDSEPEGWNSSDYKVRPLFGNFKYVKELPSVVRGGAWASALSNKIDLKW